MKHPQILDFSNKLKEISRSLSFLGQPRFPKKELIQLFPQHSDFINILDDVTMPFEVDTYDKKKLIEKTLNELHHSPLDQDMKKIFTKRLEDYFHLVGMIEHFGTIFFYEKCTRLYGTSLTQKNEAFYYFIDKLREHTVKSSTQTKFGPKEAMEYLKAKMLETFDEEEFEIKPSSSLLSDSSAGRKVLKLNPAKDYSKDELDIFLVHEGWAHLGTSINGHYQPEHFWLNTWSPGTTSLQEGLAILTEFVSKKMTDNRWNKVLHRHFATMMAEKGSSIKEIYEYLLHQGMNQIESFKLSLRIFRGVPLEGGMAFTKELLYLNGLIELLNYLHIYKIDFKSLWLGKVSFEEHLTLFKHKQELNLSIKYFPKDLENHQASIELKKLQELSFSLFRHDF